MAQHGREAKDKRVVNLRGQDNGHGIIEDTLSKQQRIEVHIHFQLIKYGQNCHYRERKKTPLVFQSLKW